MKFTILADFFHSALFFESVGVVGDFGHSNVVDEDLNMQPDQNKG